MAANYVLLEKITVGANGASSVTFNNIPQTGYTDLYIRYAARDSFNATACGTYLYFNTDRSTSYSVKRMYGNGSLPYSDQYSAISATLAGDIPGLTANASLFSNTSITIANYTSSLAKTISIDAASENNTTGAYIELLSGLWNPATNVPINAVTILSGGVAFVQYSSFSLYGVANSTTNPTKSPKAKGGDIIQNDGTYWYHAFLNNGTFTPAVGLSCDYVVVAGGGGGTYGGGGAGGLRSTVTATGGGGSLESALFLATGTSYVVTIGAGGAAGTNTTNTGASNGSNSVFGSITSIGGGRGGIFINPVAENGQSGGSGGGGGGTDSGNTAGSGGSPTTNQGFAGGSGVSFSTYNTGGGGGGAGTAGGNGVANSHGGVGGNGVAIPSFASATNTGVSNYYAGGGSGGGSVSQAGGSGGGGLGGAANNAGAAGVVNTGSGGGGGGNTSGNLAGGAGGSGLIIVRYLM